MPKLRVWWIPQVPMPMFTAEVRTFREARLLLNTLADYDLFQLEQRVKGDFCNAGGFQTFDPEDTEDGPEGSWTDWCSDDGDDFDDLTDEQVDAMDLATRPAQARDEHRSEAIIRRIRTLADQYGEKVRPGSNDVQSRVLTSVVRDLREIADEAAGTEDCDAAP